MKIYDLRITIYARVALLLALVSTIFHQPSTVFGQPVKFTGWTTTTNPVTARTALGVWSSNETAAAINTTSNALASQIGSGGGGTNGGGIATLDGTGTNTTLYYEGEGGVTIGYSGGFGYGLSFATNGAYAILPNTGTDGFITYNTSGPNLALGYQAMGTLGTNIFTQAAHEFYAGGGSSSTNFVATTNGEWALFGMSFNGGQASWPPVNAEESGMLLYSSDGINWVGGTGHPQLKGVSGYVRDPALVQVGNIYGLSYTTNQSPAPLGSKSFPILVSSNLTHWTHITNISMLLAGESDTGTNTLHWSPILTVVGTNVWLFGSVTTNGTASFKQRYRTTSVANFPYGWSATAELNNGTGLTNIIDLTPYVHTNGTVYAWYKNESAGSCDLGVFASADPSSAFTTVLSAPFGASVEGNWMVQLPNGAYRVYMVRYLYGTGWAGYGNNGGAQVLSFAESASITSGWSALTNAITPFYAQSFKPILVRDTRTHTHAAAATIGSMGLRGVVSIKGQIGRGAAGLSLGGFAFTNPFPAEHIVGLNTNDYAAINFGDENRSRGGLYARGDGTVALYVPTLVNTDTNIALGWVKDVLTARSNSVAFNVPISGNGSSLTNGGTMSANTNALASLKDAAMIAAGVSSSGMSNVFRVNFSNMGARPDVVSGGTLVVVPGNLLAGHPITEGAVTTHQLDSGVMTGARTNVTTLWYYATNSACGVNPHILGYMGGPTGMLTNLFSTTGTTFTNNGISGVFSVSVTNGFANAMTNDVGSIKVYYNTIRPSGITIWFLGGRSVFTP